MARGVRIVAVQEDGRPHSSWWYEGERGERMPATEEFATALVRNHLVERVKTASVPANLVSCTFFNGDKDCASFRFRATRTDDGEAVLSVA